MNSEERAKRFQKARTMLNTHGEEGKQKVYELTGVPASAIVAYENPESTRGLNVQYVQRLAEHYGVNAAWLLGQSESWSQDKNVQQACEMTGLSPEALAAIQELARNPERKEFINSFLASEEFSRMVYTMIGTKRLKNKAGSDVVDYTDALRICPDDTGYGFREEDYMDMRIWKAGRELENIMRAYVEGNSF